MRWAVIQARRWVAGALARAGGVLPGRAELLTYSAVADNGGSHYESGTGGMFSLTRFDSSLGTLQSAVLTITASSLGGHIWVDNEWTAAGKVQLRLGTALSLTTPEYATLEFAPEWATGLTALAADGEGEADFSGADSAQLNGTTVGETQTQAIGDLAMCIGLGQLEYSFWGEGYGWATGLSPLDVEGRLAVGLLLPLYGLTAQIDYTYTPAGTSGDDGGGGSVPEPGTMSMGLALGGVALARWMRRRRAGAGGELS